MLPSRLPKRVQEGLVRWVEAGGLLLRGSSEWVCPRGWIASLDELSALDGRPPRTDSRG